MQETFLILDFGSQFTQLIARRLREMQHFCEIRPFHEPIENIKKLNPKGIILSGGPNSVYEESSPRRDVKELAEVAPLLGICYGMQLITQAYGGRVSKSDHREYGLNTVEWSEPWVKGLNQQKVWMSHGDAVETLPPGFRSAAKSGGQHPAAIMSDRIWALQFHPEVAHTENGTAILKAFLEGLCGAKPNWSAPKMRETLQAEVLRKVAPNEHVLCALSGGVDSSVVAALLTQTLGAERVHCVFVDTGLLRKNEFENVLAMYKQWGLNVLGVNAAAEFMKGLKGLSDPEQKRKMIGKLFIDVFDRSVKESRFKDSIQWLAQGTLYPDVIESISFAGGPSHTIKSHHNVGGLPEKMKLKLLEPVRELFKDEVRKLGQELGLDEQMRGRHPFPGPGLAIRVMGEVTEEALEILREVDHVYISKLRAENLYHKIWQAFCVLLPVKTVGVQGDGRTYERVVALRAVTSQDGMTADWYPFEFQFLRELSNEITNKVRGVNRVVYDITSKPPGTIEWE